MQLFPVFSFLWALAILNHQLYHGRFFDLAPESILNYAALFCLLRPSSLGRFALLAAMQLATFVYEMPRVVNHWMLMAITNLGILVVGKDVESICFAAAVFRGLRVFQEAGMFPWCLFPLPLRRYME